LWALSLDTLLALWALSLDTLLTLRPFGTGLLLALRPLGPLLLALSPVAALRALCLRWGSNGDGCDCGRKKHLAGHGLTSRNQPVLLAKTR
jgi:hypothetical protein